MPDYFDEKAQQVSPNNMTAFGIDIQSRYGRANEVIQMINFARQAALKDVAHYVKSMFYDSKACVCTLTLVDEVSLGDPVEAQLREIALECLSQFEWFDSIDFTDTDVRIT